MPTDLKPRNQADSDEEFDTASDLAEREFDFSQKINDGQHDRIKGYDRSADGLDAYEKEASNDDEPSDKFTNSDGGPSNYNADDPNKNRDEAKEKEEGADGLYSPGGKKGGKSGFRGFLKNKKLGASSTLLGGSLVTLVITGILSSFAAPLVMMERILTNANAHDVRTNSMMMKGRQGSIMGSIGKDRDCTKARIMCKVTEMSNAEKKRWEKMGIKVDSNKSIANPTRNKVKSMTVTLPGNKNPTVITSAGQFNELMRTNSDFQRMAWRVQHPLAASFISPVSKMKTKILNKFGVNRGVFKSSSNKDKQTRTDEMNKNIDTHTGADPPDTDPETIKKKKQSQVKDHSGVKNVSEHAKSKMKGIGFKSGGTFGLGLATSAIETACVSYNIVRTVSAVTKLVYYKDLIGVMYPFIQAAGQIVDEGNVDPETIEYLADRMTWYDNKEFLPDGKKNSKFGLTALDSQGIQAALYGDHGKLKEFTKNYTPWYVTSGVAMSAEVNKLQETFGKENIRAFCLAGKTAGYAVAAAGIAGGATACILSFGISCVLQGIGAIGGFIAGSIAGEEVVETLIETMTSESAARIVAAGLNSDLKGVDLGNELASAMGILMMQKDMGSGTKPASDPAQVTTYLSQTDEYYSDYIAMQRDKAKNEPLNPYSQYTFLGKIVTAFNTYKVADNSAFGFLANIGALTTKPLGIFNQTAHAGYHQPIEMVRDTETLNASLSRSEDADMARIGALSDWQGRSINIVEKEPIMWAKQMENGDDTPWYNAIEYMMGGKYIDGDGKPIDYDNYKEASEEENDYDNEYLMYKAYCTEDRVYPLGTTITPIDDYGNGGDKAGWKDGGKCLGNNDEGQEDPKLKEKLNYFFFYYNMCETQMGIADGNQKCWEDESTQALASARPNTGGDWVTPTSGTCLSKYGMRTLGGRTALHAGIDISPPAGTPIVAPTSMTITLAGYTNDGYGVMVTAKATDGSDYSFRFGHMGPSNSYKPPVQAGQQVSKGDVIGEVGSTGNSTGPHLHFEIFPPGKDPAMFSGSTDPVPVLRERGVSITCGA